MIKTRRKMVFLILTMLILPLTLPVKSAYAVLDLEEGWLPEKPEWAPDFDTSASFLTQYIWRGQNLGSEPVMQYDANVSKWGFTFDFFVNYSLNNNKQIDNGLYQEITELDYTISYDFNVGEALEKMNMESPGIFDPVGISLGYIYYTFPNQNWNELEVFDSHEIFLGASYDVLLQPFFTWYLDVDQGTGSYLQFGVGHTFEFEESGISANVGTAFGYNYHQWTPEAGWSDVLLSGDVSIPIFNYFYITPSVGWSIILDPDTYEDAQKNEFYGGITFGFSY
ncbi:MAG: hypothetical protein ACE5JK_01095 [Candidatus Omnitrophota bacterium]